MRIPMRFKVGILAITCLTVIAAAIVIPEQLLSGPAELMLEDFQKYNRNPFTEWEYRKEYNKAAEVYSIIEENENKYLRGSTTPKHSMVQIGKQVNQNNLLSKNKIDWDIFSYPNLSWDWRITTIPEGANEKHDNTNDSAASIYVVFQKMRVPFASWEYQPANWIKYVWSSTLPVGTVITRKFSRFGMSLYEGKYIVVASGKKDLGKWITVKRNVLADYKTHFGKSPSFNPIVIGILTDSNSTDSSAEADYDNIKASNY
jgi:hypothetical protein